MQNTACASGPSIGSSGHSKDTNLKIRSTWANDVNVDQIDVVDPYTVRFHTNTPTPHMLARLANDRFIYPPKYLAETDARALARRPIGTGPFVFKEWTTGDKITVEANPDYWDSPKPSLNTVVFRWVPEHAARLASLKTGAVDLMDLPAISLMAVPGAGLPGLAISLTVLAVNIVGAWLRDELDPRMRGR
jgi:ABC-type transport system substrate-binding protein